LDERIGGPGQYDGRQPNPNRFYLPLAGAQSRVVLTYCDRRILTVEPGPAFDPGQWDNIAQEIETSVLAGPMKVGGDYSFSSYRVHGSWRGERTLLLNTRLRGRTNLQPPRSSHFWAFIHHDSAGRQSQWAQNFYFAPMGGCVLDSQSPLTGERLEVIESEAYYTQLMGIDGKGLRLPDDLDNSICRYRDLGPQRKEEFDRAAYCSTSPRACGPFRCLRPSPPSCRPLSP
jgi:hypothetical protein